MRTFSLKSRFARPAFTLVELLVAITIIAVLAALAAAGIFQVIVAQRNSNTQNTMRTVAEILKKHVQAVRDKADKETIPPSVLAMAGNDPGASDRARVIWKKLRLKQEFPMTFAEALAPYVTYAGAPGLPPGDLPALGAYATALQNIPAVNNVLQVNNAPQPFLESSVCILLALQQNRGVPSLSPDDLKAAAVAVGITDNSGNQPNLKALVDGWGNPIAFFRFPTGSIDLDKSNPAQSGRGANFRDPFDPDGLLLNSGWLTSNGLAFSQLAHVVYPPTSKYILPVLVSAGPDGKWGLNTMVTAPGINPDMSLDPSVDPNTGAPVAAFSNDNVYSYQLR